MTYLFPLLYIRQRQIKKDMVGVPGSEPSFPMVYRLEQDRHRQ